MPLLPDDSVRQGPGRSSSATSALVVAEATTISSGIGIGLRKGIKRIIDVILSLSAIILLVPLLTIVAILVKLDSKGPVIFRQRRNGLNSVEFVIFKFRTMTVLEDGPNVTQARQGDHRVTRIGQYLRRMSIDELPQLANVLRGEMSLVGPRPHALAHDNEYLSKIAKYSLRYQVKPGITGWAQINGLRGETPDIENMAERVEYDLWYIKNWSLRLDLYIILKTCFEVVTHRAY